MVAKFTPGPWGNNEPNGGETLARVWYVRKDTKGIMHTLHIQSPLFRGLPGEGEANAHLIAAAPELYAALEAAYAWIDEIVSPGTGLKLRGEIREALKKARGEK